MPPRKIVTLTTDFGNEGPYVAAMKGVLLGLVPDLVMVDVSHTVTPQNILEGAFVLGALSDCFPPETVHLAVVDPGVGTDRRLIAVRADNQWYVLPDNGLITGVLLRHPAQVVHAIENPAISRGLVSSTFHGRDILAPAAAFLLNGGSPADMGPQLTQMVRLANFEPRSDHEGPVGEVIFRDAFGNLITNVRGDFLESEAPLRDWSLTIADERIDGLERTYGMSHPGSLIALIGSTGFVEVAVVNGDASRHLAAGSGTTVWFRKRKTTS